MRFETTPSRQRLVLSTRNVRTLLAKLTIAWSKRTIFVPHLMQRRTVAVTAMPGSAPLRVEGHLGDVYIYIGGDDLFSLLGGGTLTHGSLAVAVEPDMVHYADREPPGAMHPATEALLALYE